MKIIVYTCITGNYDKLIEIKHKEKNYEYICFTNNKTLESKTWDIKYIDENLDNLLLARKVKVLGNKYLPKHDVSVWVDGAVDIIKTISEFISNECDFDQYDMIGFKHKYRDCIYDEISACVDLRKETIDNAKRLEKFLKTEKYPKNNGLIESTVIVRKNNACVNNLMNAWFYMIENYSKRDQLSFNYCLWKKPINIKMLDMYVFNNKYFKHVGHNKYDYIDYRIIFDDKKEFDFHDAIDATTVVNNGKVLIKHKCITNTNNIVLQLSNESGSIISDIIINNKKSNITLFNTKDIMNKTYFVDTPIILFKGNFKKGDNIIISFKFIRNDKNKLIDILCKSNDVINEYNSELNDYRNKYNILKESYDKVINSKVWRYTDKIRNIKKRIKNINCNPLLSVIIPAYNCENYVGQTLNSLVNQTYKNIEIIIIDDGSTDKTNQICKEYADRYKNIKLFKQKNANYSIACNNGIKKVTGEYFTFCDSDDYFELNAFEKIMKKIVRFDLDGINYEARCVYDGIDEKDSYIKHNRYIESQDYSNQVLNGYDYFRMLRRNGDFSSCVWSFVFKTDIIKKNNIDFINKNNLQHTDTIFSFEFLYHAERVSFIKKILYNRRVRMDSSMTSKSSIHKVYAYWLMLNRLYERYHLNNDEYMGFLKDINMLLNTHLSNITNDDILNHIDEIENDEEFVKFLKQERKLR